MNDWGLLLIRFMLGIVFLYHGGQKLFSWFGGHGIAGMAEFLGTMNVPAPTVSAWLAGLAEFVGGVSLILGLWMRVLLIPTIFTMFVAVLMVHRSAFSLQHNGMEYALTLAIVLMALWLLGPGRISLSYATRAQRDSPGPSTAR